MRIKTIQITLSQVIFHKRYGDIAGQSDIRKHTMPLSSKEPQDRRFALITGIMTRFNHSGDIISALRWALPQFLSALSAEAVSLFLHDHNTKSLQCIICLGPVDITGMEVPLGEGIVGRVFSSGQAEVVSNVQDDQSHFSHSDQNSGFTTKSLITAPVLMPEQSFGVIQVINRIALDNVSPRFDQTDLELLEGLANALALAFSHLELTKKAVNAQMLKRDLSEAADAQQLLMPAQQQQSEIAGQVIPARQISGDFFDYLYVDNWIAFCFGDVSGKGMAAGLMMAQCLTLFRYQARCGVGCIDIANTINNEWLEKTSGRFATMVIGWFNQNTGDLHLINCGHGHLIYWPETPQPVDAPILISSHTTPIGVIAYADVDIWRGTLDHSASLYLFSDGISEAMVDETNVIEVQGVINLSRQHHDMTATERVDAIMRLVREGQLETHDDASMLVISRKPSQKRLYQCELPARPTALPKARRFIDDILSQCGWNNKRDDIQIAIGEVLQNIIRHARWRIKSEAKMSININPQTHQMKITITDNAWPQDARLWNKDASSKTKFETRVPKRGVPETRINGGMGLELVKILCQDVNYSANDDGNSVILSFKDN